MAMTTEKLHYTANVHTTGREKGEARLSDGRLANFREQRPNEDLLQDFRRLSVGAWVAIVVLIGLLVAAIVGVSVSGTDDLGSDMSGPGAIAMTFGVLFTIAVGVSLMGLIFYSSRRGYDDPPTVEPTSRDQQD
jgi:hypothetical protein